MANSKRQQTMAKMTREQAVKERRAQKQEKKQAAAALRNAQAADGTPPTDAVDDAVDDATSSADPSLARPGTAGAA